MNKRIKPPDQASADPRDAGRSPADADGGTRVLLVTGMSGAGKSSALKALEDMGYEAVDNLPLSLLAHLAKPRRGHHRPLAIGVDVRTRDFGVGPFLDELEELISNRALDVRVLFLDCDDEALRRRFTETRRRHPLARDRPVTDGIRLERGRLERLRDQADTVIDTTDYTGADLKRWMQEHFSPDRQPGVAIFVTSFAYGRGLPREADLVFDARFLSNPHYVDELRLLTGRDAPVAEFIRADPGFARFFDSVTGLLEPLLSRFEHEGKSNLTIAVGCTGGRHRSVFVAERLADWLADHGQRVSLRHRDLGRDHGTAPVMRRAIGRETR